jgi:glycosyltransferase involved in cell wall biosynthesis
MPRVLFIASHRPDRSPSQRFRFEQYFSWLNENGFETELSPIITEKDDQIFYKPGNFFGKLGILLRSWSTRRADKRNFKKYDIVFVQREAMMVGSTYFEKKIKSSGAKFVFDFDDSIWLMDTSAGNKKWEWLKNPEKTSKNVSYADLVFAGNNYLADYARKFNKNVVVIPTTIDTGKFFPDHSKKMDDKIVIGWSGSITTIKHFEYALNYLSRIKKKYGDKVELKVVGDETYFNSELNIRGIKWSSDDEVKTLNTFDIGIMPLPDDEWAKGKCGLKGLSYMSLEIPTIMSPVGVNTEIIDHGVNGFLASTTEEWVDAIEKLIEQPELRKTIGVKARKTVLEKYSVESQKNNYLRYFREVLNSK